jgi:hypothetical protein
VEFRQYPPLVDKFLQYARIIYPHVIHNVWIINIGDKVIQSENTNIISNNSKVCNGFSVFIHNGNILCIEIVHKDCLCEKPVDNLWGG